MGTVGEFHTEDVEAWLPTYDVRGRDAFVDAIRSQNAPYEIRVENRPIAETNDTLVFEWTWSTPHPDDRERWVALRGLSYFVFEGTRISRLHRYWDMPGFLAGFEP